MASRQPQNLIHMLDQLLEGLNIFQLVSQKGLRPIQLPLLRLILAQHRIYRR